VRAKKIFPSVEPTTYDRCECTAEHQIYPLIREKPIGDITAADLKEVLNHWMNEGYAYTTVKKAHVLLNEFFRYLTQQEIIVKNPMQSVPMMKKANFLAAQEKKNLPESETITVFSEEELEKFKAEAFSTFSNGKRKYQQASAYILMLNTGLRTGELLGLLNSDIDLENKVIHLERGVKEVWRRDGFAAESGRDVKVGKLKTATSKRTVPLNKAAIRAIEEFTRRKGFRAEFTTCCRRERRLHPPGELPQEILPHFESCGDRAKRPAQPPSHFRNPVGEWCETGRQYDKIPHTTAGGGFVRPQHQPNHPNVLRQEGHSEVERDHG